LFSLEKQLIGLEVKHFVHVLIEFIFKYTNYIILFFIFLKMDDIFSNFIKEIYTYISNDKLDKFIKCVKNFEKENNLNLNILENNLPSKEIKIKKKKVPKDLEKKLFEITNVEKITFKFNEKSSDDEIIDICDRILNYLDDLEKRNKTYIKLILYTWGIIKYS
jgi:hypothetical protein